MEKINYSARKVLEELRGINRIFRLRIVQKIKNK